MNILPVVFKQICQFSTLNFSKGHTFLEILLPDLSPLWTPVLENMNLFSVQFRKGNNLSWGPCGMWRKIPNEGYRLSFLLCNKQIHLSTFSNLGTSLHCARTYVVMSVGLPTSCYTPSVNSVFSLSRPSTMPL